MASHIVAWVFVHLSMQSNTGIDTCQSNQDNSSNEVCFLADYTLCLVDKIKTKPTNKKMNKHKTNQENATHNLSKCRHRHIYCVSKTTFLGDTDN